MADPKDTPDTPDTSEAPVDAASDALPEGSIALSTPLPNGPNVELPPWEELEKAILHVGAHKTASTHFTRVIRQNFQMAQGLGVRVPVRALVREMVTHRLSSIPDKRPVPAGYDVDARDMALGLPKMFVIDENIMGTPRNLFSGGQMYPRADRRLRRAARLFEGLPVDVMLGIRNPATFLASAWSESLRTNMYQSFDDYCDGAIAQDVSWAAVMDRLFEAVPQAHFVLYRYEDYPGVLPQLVSRGLDQSPDTVLDYEPIETPVRVGLSQAALDEVHRIAAAREKMPSKEEVDAIMEQMPKSAEFPAPMPWSPEDAALLGERYETDVAHLANHPRVTFLR